MPFKFEIDPEHESGNDTLCQTLRYLYRRAQAEGRSQDMHDIAKCFSYGKQMDARLKYYRSRYEPHRRGPEVPHGGA